MRATSFRRRSGQRVLGSVTDATVRAGDAPRLSDFREDPESEGAVECQECGAWVKVLASGRPRTHAPGGTGTSTRKGIYKCSGSGLV